jgi:hypothetical protein
MSNCQIKVENEGFNNRDHQEGVSSPLLWSLVIDKLLTDLDSQGNEVLA